MLNDWLEKRRVVVLSGVGALVAASAGAVALRAQPAQPLTIEPPPPSVTPAPTPTPGPIRVYISGAVAEPDVYELPPEAIVRDAVAAAGGAATDADLDRINLAQSLVDGQHVQVPHVGDEPTPAPAASSSEGSSGEDEALAGPLNINTADAAELELLPGIGPVIAARIVEYREANGPFTSIEAIQNVSGIGPAKFEGIREWIVTE